MKIAIVNSPKFATNFKQTVRGPIALIDGIWYSVNGDEKLIVDLRYMTTQPVTGLHWTFFNSVTGLFFDGTNCSVGPDFAKWIKGQPHEPTLRAVWPNAVVTFNR
jgi:hypothetical protein